MEAKVFKLEVPDYGDDEINRMAIAYAALSYLDERTQFRALSWLNCRLERERMDATLRTPDTPNLTKVK